MIESWKIPQPGKKKKSSARSFRLFRLTTTVVAATVKPPLEDALAFDAPEVCLRFAREKALSEQDVAYLFNETKRWLWACACRVRDEQAGLPVPAELLISPELTAIDELWHCFILFTEEYERFCRERLGVFIHHRPIKAAELARFEELRRTDPKRALAERQAQLKPQLEYLYDLLGPDVLRDWYQRLPAGFGAS